MTAVSESEPFDFGTIRLQPASWGFGMLTAECMRPTCGWVMTFSAQRLNTIIETCRDHACRRLCTCGQAERMSA